MLAAALVLLTDLETAIIGEPCQPDLSRVTAGEPAAPNPGCVDLAVWIGDVTDGNAFGDGCLVRSRLRLHYRIGWCYTDDGDGPTEAQELEAATCLYNLMDAVWCYLVDNRATVAGADRCDTVDLEPLIVQPRSGGWVAAQGSIVIDWDCIAS